jgi:hypothetical protein
MRVDQARTVLRLQNACTDCFYAVATPSASTKKTPRRSKQFAGRSPRS